MAIIKGSEYNGKSWEEVQNEMFASNSQNDILFVSKYFKAGNQELIVKIISPQALDENGNDYSWFVRFTQEFNGKTTFNLAFVGIVVEKVGKEVKFIPRVVVLNSSGAKSLIGLVNADWDILSPYNGHPIKFTQDKANPAFPKVVATVMGKPFQNNKCEEEEYPALEEVITRLLEGKKDKSVDTAKDQELEWE